MDIAFRNICEIIAISGPHGTIFIIKLISFIDFDCLGISWDQFKDEIKSLMNLKDSQSIWPPSEPLKYILNIYAGLKLNFLIGKQTQTSSEKLKVNKYERIY